MYHGWRDCEHLGMHNLSWFNQSSSSKIVQVVIQLLVSLLMIEGNSWLTAKGWFRSDSTLGVERHSLPLVLAVARLTQDSMIKPRPCQCFLCGSMRPMHDVESTTRVSLGVHVCLGYGGGKLQCDQHKICCSDNAGCLEVKFFSDTCVLCPCYVSRVCLDSYFSKVWKGSEDLMVIVQSYSMPNMDGLICKRTTFRWLILSDQILDGVATKATSWLRKSSIINEAGLLVKQNVVHFDGVSERS